MAGNIICAKCGQANGPDLTFCSSCGAFLEWSGEKPAEDEGTNEGTNEGATEVSPPATAPPADGSELAGLARSRPQPSQPPPVSPVRPGPSRQSVPATVSATRREADLPGPQAAAGVAPAPAAEPTIACPACGRANPVARNFCHSCGTLLRPKPREPMARRRRTSGGPYRLLSILLLVAIVLVGSFLLTRLTAAPAGSTPSPSPSRGSITLLIGG
jgi:predicted nucleic acid-binding Zn ribbon protein